MKLRARLLAFGIVLMSGALLVVNAQAPKDATEASTGSSMAASGDAAASALPLGWNVVLSQNCQIYYQGSNIAYNVYASNGAVFWSTIWQFQNVMEPSCQTGRWLALYVTDGPTAAWSPIYAMTYSSYSPTPWSLRGPRSSFLSSSSPLPSLIRPGTSHAYVQNLRFTLPPSRSSRAAW